MLVGCGLLGFGLLLVVVLGLGFGVVGLLLLGCWLFLVLFGLGVFGVCFGIVGCCSFRGLACFGGGRWIVVLCLGVLVLFVFRCFGPCRRLFRGRVCMCLLCRSRTLLLLLLVSALLGILLRLVGCRLGLFRVVVVFVRAR